jgi:hypothetical protein
LARNNHRRLIYDLATSARHSWFHLKKSAEKISPGRKPISGTVLQNRVSVFTLFAANDFDLCSQPVM